jgi:MoxR-like ATPase
MSSSLQQLQSGLARELGRVVVGAEHSIRALVIALVARGHVLVQGVPGLGKTLLAKTLARALGGEFKRIQGTPDLMPSDIIGVHVFDESQRTFVFRPGPLFADVVLVDEVNRAGPKTQSALLEAMEERQASVDRAVFALPEDFLVLATQNPREFEGTYPLPESQLDRQKRRSLRAMAASLLPKPCNPSSLSTARCSLPRVRRQNGSTSPMHSRATYWTLRAPHAKARSCRSAFPLAVRSR